MESSSRGGEVRTGLFVVVALALLIFAILWIVGAGLGGSDRRSVDVWLDDAGGVRSGDPVRLAGIRVGQVESVELRPSEELPVLARIAIDRQVELREGASARLISDGLLGSKVLAVEPGPLGGTPLGDDEPIRGQSAAGIDDALATVASLGEDAGALLQETRETLQRLTPRIEGLLTRGEDLLAEENVDEVASTVRSLRKILDEVGPRLGPLVQRLDGVASDLEEGMAHVPQLATDLSGVAQDVRQALGPDGERLSSSLDSARHTLDAARLAFEDAERVLSAVGDEGDDLQATIRDLRRAAANLEALSRTLKERPDRLLRPRRRADRAPGEQP